MLWGQERATTSPFRPGQLSGPCSASKSEFHGFTSCLNPCLHSKCHPASVHPRGSLALYHVGFEGLGKGHVGRGWEMFLWLLQGIS